jgi:trehalose-6-phosphate synthase
MRRTFQLILPLAISVICISLFYTAHQVRVERRNLRDDLSQRAAVLAENLQERLEPFSGRIGDTNLNRIVQRYGQREQLVGVGVYNDAGKSVATTSALPADFAATEPAQATRAETIDKGFGGFINLHGEPLYVYALPLHKDNKVAGTLLVVYNTSYIQSRIWRVLRSSLFTTGIQTLLIVSLAFVLVRWMFTAPLDRTVKWLRTLQNSSAGVPASLPRGELFDQIHSEAQQLADALHTARAAAEEEAHLRDSQSTVWTADRLRVSLRNKLAEKSLFVVSNREPYMHVMNGNDSKSVQVLVPASGLVTALEPVLIACNGTWIASGSGSGDRLTVDSKDHLLVPPDHPEYLLRRVWVTPEEEHGYYEGFSNEGLWPLCHIAHTRPVFRPEDWNYYQRINRRFADAVLQEIENTPSPVVLAQDYHFALLPKMIKDARPDARVAIFWHIPWPNPEVFGICPWQAELVDGLLGGDMVGFHTQTHCNNFLATVDRALEALTDWDRFEVLRRGHLTRVRPYPISVAFSQPGPSVTPRRSRGEELAALCAEIGIEASILAVGVDRMDYTKGIIERLRGVERFLDLYPAYVGRFTFVQIGAPSRTSIPRYQQFLDEVSAETERINARFQNGNWKPIVLLKRHHSHQEIERYYRAATVCLVTSLHDGMNLVAKEFIASRDDDRGILILSTFTGAAQELTDALQVNPYDVEQVANAINQALSMGEEEEMARMRRMRKIVLEYNIYRWAATMISDMSEIRVESHERAEAAYPQ